MPRWDHGSFFHQVAEPLLTSGHRITVYDTLSLLRDGDDLTALVDRWGRHLAPHADGAYGPSPAPDLLVGNALGGAVVQALLTHEWSHHAKVLLISGPSVADDELDTKLERIAAAVQAQGLPSALRLLDEAVRGPGRQPGATTLPRTEPDAGQPTDSEEGWQAMRLSMRPAAAARGRCPRPCTGLPGRPPARVRRTVPARPAQAPGHRTPPEAPPDGRTAGRNAPPRRPARPHPRHHHPLPGS